MSVFTGVTLRNLVVVTFLASVGIIMLKTILRTVPLPVPEFVRERIAEI